MPGVDYICRCFRSLFVNPIDGSGLPVDKFFLIEPQGNFLVSGFNSIRAVDDVAANLDAVVTTDGAGHGIGGVGGAQHLTAGLDNIQALPHHGNHWAGAHVVDQTGEEGTSGQIGIMLFQQFLGSL